MIDTIKILISRDKYIVSDYMSFNTTKLAMENNPAGYYSYINTYARSKKLFYYYPKVTICKQGRNYNLIVEFSAPKIIFGENLSELDNTYFEDLIRKLITRLNEMGVIVNSKNLINADVISLHASKNIFLKNIKPQEIIRELSKNENPMRLDVNRKSYTNNGESLQFHASSHELVLYDKMADMVKSKIRSIDKLKPKIALPNINILRIEARLIKKRKLNSILKRLGYQKNPILRDVFNEQLCKLVVLTFWNDYVIKGRPPITQDTTLNTLKNIILAMKPKMKKAIYLTGLLTIINSEDGIGGLASQLKESYPQGRWQRIKVDINKLNKTIINNNDNFLVEIEKQLKEFQPIDLSKYYYDRRDQKGTN